LIQRMREKTKKRFVFGPVPSRRLGKSLGIDFLPFKTCTYDCIYCQLGRTTNKTTHVKEYFPVDAVIQDIQNTLDRIYPPDYITLSGSGEPTLYSHIRNLILGIKRITDIPIAVLTNGSLLWIEDIRNSLLDADLLIPSLDAGTAEKFLYVNRPHRDITYKKMVDGLCSLRKHYHGLIWLEIFLIKGINVRYEEIMKIKFLVDRIGPDRIQLNTAVRTPAESFVNMVEKNVLNDIATIFGPRCEIIADYQQARHHTEFKLTRNDVFEMLKRRPCSIDDIASGLDLHRNEVIKYVQDLVDRKMVQTEKRSGRILYLAYGNHNNNT
jgi:wyosine [tRNA(Phe)-imidazoG37] synthetase (radical SAM superfamily)